MKWIELVRVRSSETALRAALPALRAQVGEIDDSGADAEAHFMQHALYDGDLAVLLVWRSRAEPHKTREGLMVANSLRRLGSVDHAVWIPAPH